MPRPTQTLSKAFAPVVALNGLFFVVIGLTELSIALFDLLYFKIPADAFAFSGVVTLFLGGSMLFMKHSALRGEMLPRQIVFSMVFPWVTISLISVLPLMIGAPDISFADAFFETTSAYTTTGFTMLSGLDQMPRDVLIWRSLMHWYGGLGVVIAAMVFFPAMRIGGMQVFLRDGFEKNDKILPSARVLALATSGAYALLTFFCLLALLATGVPGFDAMNLAMSIMATGGMAVLDTSFSVYSMGAKWVGTVFMLVAAFPLIVTVMAMRGQPSAYFKDPQIPAFFKIALFNFMLIFLFRAFSSDVGLPENLTDTAFNYVSLLTGTGLATTDYGTWGAFPFMILFMATFIGGCTGSTAGSIKIFRYQLLYEMVRNRLRLIFYPNAIFPNRYMDNVLDDETIDSVAAFFIVYLLSFAFFTVLFLLTGVDLLTAVVASSTSIGNVGVAFGDVIGPTGGYYNMPDAAIWIGIPAMIMGRIELILFYVLFLPRFWYR